MTNFMYVGYRSAAAGAASVAVAAWKAEISRERAARRQLQAISDGYVGIVKRLKLGRDS